MARLELLQGLPANIDSFIDEIGENLHRLYGPLAKMDYIKRARRGIAANIAHPHIRTYGVMEGKDALGLLFAITRGHVGEIAFLHVLDAEKGLGHEGLLLNQAVEDFHDDHIYGIVCETILNSGLSLADSLVPLGFRHFSRELMHCSLHRSVTWSESRHRCTVLGPGDWKAAAQCIVRAYQGHPGRLLHGEVHQDSAALDFIARVQAGNYGEVRQGYGQCMYHRERCIGVILGAGIAPDVGFILQVAVDPAYRKQGVGEALIQALHSIYVEAGLSRMALGVTLDNPARNLYLRLGFDSLHSIDTYAWWRNFDATLRGGVG